jgi:hypothetical protein
MRAARIVGCEELRPSRIRPGDTNDRRCEDRWALALGPDDDLHLFGVTGMEAGEPLGGIGE